MHQSLEKFNIAIHFLVFPKKIMEFKIIEYLYLGPAQFLDNNPPPLFISVPLRHVLWLYYTAGYFRSSSLFSHSLILIRWGACSLYDQSKRFGSPPWREKTIDVVDNCFFALSICLLYQHHSRSCPPQEKKDLTPYIC